MAALPKAFVMLGLGFGGGFLMLMAFMTRENEHRGVLLPPLPRTAAVHAFPAAAMPALPLLPTCRRLVDRGAHTRHAGNRRNELPAGCARAVRPRRRARPAAVARLPLRGCALGVCREPAEVRACGGGGGSRQGPSRAGSPHLPIPCPPHRSGLMIVYLIVSADILAGHAGEPGLVCDLLGASPGSSLCGSRQLAAGLVAALCIVRGLPGLPGLLQHAWPAGAVSAADMLPAEPAALPCRRPRRAPIWLLRLRRTRLPVVLSAGPAGGTQAPGIHCHHIVDRTGGCRHLGGSHARPGRRGRDAGACACA